MSRPIPVPDWDAPNRAQEDKDMEYEQAVAEAKRLVKRSEEDQWRLAELTWEQVEAGVAKKQWARDIGVSDRWVRVLNAVWAEFGAETLRPSFSEAVNQVMTGGLTSSEAAKERGRAAPPTPEAVTQAIREDPAVRDAVGHQIRTEPEVAQSLAEPSEGISIPEAKQMAIEAERELGPDLVRPITRLNVIVSELQAVAEAEEVAQRLMEERDPIVIRSLGRSIEFLTKVHQLASQARRPQVVG